MTDDTQRHNAQLALSRDRDEQRRRVQAVLDAGGPQIVVQPIVDLTTGAVVGGEALSRFAGPPVQGPDRWFADAMDVDWARTRTHRRRLGARHPDAMPGSAYLSINVSPCTAASTALLDLLESSTLGCTGS